MPTLSRRTTFVAQLAGPAWTADAVAGLSTGILLVPQAIAYAVLAGLPPRVGLYAAFVAPFVYACIGSSRHLAVGPVALDSLLVATTLAGIGVTATTNDPLLILALAGLLAMMTGGIQLLAAALKLGAVARLLTRPVLLGFTAGAALWIASSQVIELLGVKAATGRAPLEVAYALYLSVTNGSFHLPTAGLGLGLLGLAVGLKKWFPKIPRALVLVVFGTVCIATLDLTEAGVSVVGNLPAGLPVWSWPGQALEYAPSLVTAAAVLALLSFSEGYASGLTFAQQAGDSPPSPNRELLALGLSNLATGLFSGYPVAGGLSRTAVNAQAGAVTKRAGLWSAVVVGLALLVLTPLFFFLPRSALAAMILMALAGFFDIDAWRTLLRAHRPGAAVGMLTLLATGGFGITYGLAIGIALGYLSRLLTGDSGVTKTRLASPSANSAAY